MQWNIMKIIKWILLNILHICWNFQILKSIRQIRNSRLKLIIQQRIAETTQILG
jgi:hypothetical protein